MKIPHAVALVLALLFVPLLLFAQYQPVDKLGKLVYVQAEFVRANNNTAYANKDVFSSATFRYLVFPDVVKYAGYSGCIERLDMSYDTVTVATTYFLLYLFTDTTSLSTQVDNASYKESWENFRYLIAFQNVAPSGTSDTVAFGYNNAPLPFIAKTKTLYGLLLANSAVSPKRNGKVRVGLWIRRN